MTHIATFVQFAAESCIKSKDIYITIGVLTRILTTTSFQLHIKNKYYMAILVLHTLFQEFSFDEYP